MDDQLAAEILDCLYLLEADWRWKDKHPRTKRDVEWVRAVIERFQEYLRDKLIERIDEMLLAGQFDAVDEMLEKENVKGASIERLLAILTTTLPAKARLCNRRDFVDRVKAEFKRRKQPDELLVGLA
ncbi:MAG: hypothetical protein KatS3mg105_3311 [Gemmatales bacterium]|nr:MAG: hypothetical protein KatS3mg105_3311 [Gemmatales bacterium]